MRCMVLGLIAWSVAACREDAASAPQVYDGKVVAAGDKAYEFVKYAVIGEGSEGRFVPQGFCTASAVSTHTALLAAHCVLDLKTGMPKEIRLRHALGALLRPDQVFVHPAYRVAGSDQMTESTAHDLALMTFKLPLFEKVLALHSGPLAEAEIYGFGASSLDAQGNPQVDNQLRRGTVVPHHVPVAGFETGIPGTDTTPVLFFRSSDAGGAQATSGVGDSGGPLLIDGKQRGVCSGGGSYEDGSRNAVYVDLQEPSNAQFLKQNVSLKSL